MWQLFTRILPTGLHATNAPAEHNDASIEIQYRNGEAKVKMPNQGQGKSR